MAGALAPCPVLFNAFTDFAAALETKSYAAVPSDWLLAVTDVVQSTPAIAAGRYKDVNLAGAATIAGIVNACGRQDLPFAFGGDGAVVLVPPELAGQTRIALQGVQKVSRAALALDLRCALVPVRAIRARGKDVRVAFHALGSKRVLAMLSGGGIESAENLAKGSHGADFIVSADAASPDADLTGLSCRWQPLQSRHGVMISLIVKMRTDGEGIPPLYAAIYRRIQEAAGRDHCPVARTNLRLSWPPRGARIERAFGHDPFTVYGQSLLALISERTGVAIGGFAARTYAGAIPLHSDYRKFADSLRMVIDCAPAEADAIAAILAASRARGDIEFGMHRASAALMTCFVSSTAEGGHVHFVDGADGGYALAAQELKSRSRSGS
jgi:hypothetical protein